jgi:S-DNA-T family DNA segregation ATPase FtsK/SpoIIIE
MNPQNNQSAIANSEPSQPSGSVWKDATARIQATIGVDDAGKPLEIFFGVADDGRPCAHGVLVAMTGAGKTALFHTLIASLVTQYTPDELKLMLMDGKMGVSFNAYKDLPHAEIISLNTQPSLARSLLNEIIDEMIYRNELFKRHKVEDYVSYRGLGSPEGPLPRMLLIADEYQILFDEDLDQQSAKALLRISEQARSAGVHMLLGSQHMAPAQMSYRDLIFSNFHLRINMKMPANEVIATMDLGPNARDLITRTCTQTGRVVVNDYAGDDTRNTTGMTYYVDDAQRQEIITKLQQLMPNTKEAVILDGDDQPSITESSACKSLLSENYWEDPQKLEQLARTQARDGGFGIPDWLASECPIALMLGRQFNVYGQAMIVLRRKKDENICLIGEQPQVQSAMIASSIASCCMQLPPNKLEIFISDSTPAGGEGSDVGKSIAEYASSIGCNVRFYKEEYGARKLINLAYKEASRRHRLKESRRQKPTTVLFVLIDSDRVTPLQHTKDDYGEADSLLSKSLQGILEKGPSVGVHVITSFASMSNAKAVMSEKIIQSAFKHKIATQMSDNDSFSYINSQKASKLQQDGPKPINALLIDNQQEHYTEFRPYTIARSSNSDSVDSGSIIDHLNYIFMQLQTRSGYQPRKGMREKIRSKLLKK